MCITKGLKLLDALGLYGLFTRNTLIGAEPRWGYGGFRDNLLLTSCWVGLGSRVGFLFLILQILMFPFLNTPQGLNTWEISWLVFGLSSTIQSQWYMCICEAHCVYEDLGLFSILSSYFIGLPCHSHGCQQSHSSNQRWSFYSPTFCINLSWMEYITSFL